MLSIDVVRNLLLPERRRRRCWNVNINSNSTGLAVSIILIVISCCFNIRAAASSGISPVVVVSSVQDEDVLASGTYKISPKPCNIEHTRGTCMFVWECLKSEGKHLGMCVDGFMFGSCCGHNEEQNSVLTTSNVSSGNINQGTPFITSYNSSTTTTTTPTTTTTTTTTTSRPYTWATPNSTGSASWRPPPSTATPSSWPTTNSPIIQWDITTTTPRPLPVVTHPTTPTTTTTPRPSTHYVNLLTSSTTVEPEVVLEGNVPCGQAPLYPQMRIVGGKEASFGLFPWIASVRRTSFFGFSSTHRCGGALLNQNWIATAGHCVDDLLTSQIRVRLGEWDFSSTSTNSNNNEKYVHVERTVIKKIVHPSYNFFTYENDLALLQLEAPIKFSPHISPICLPGNNDLLIGENATVAGWGRLSENGQLPSRLQHVVVPIMSNSKCRELFLKSNRVEHIPDIFLCAGYEKGGQDSCQGDSGGPLQVRGRDGKYFLAGIISWGIGCAEPNMPGVCTRVSKFIDWILAHM